MNRRSLGVTGLLFALLVSSSSIWFGYFLLTDPRVVPSPPNESTDPRASEVSGTEFYAEQVAVDVSGPHSAIRQTLITNDSNIFQGIDFNDPAFYKGSFFISTSNGKTPAADPPQYVPGWDEKSHLFSKNAFVGFLYYDEELTLADVEWKSQRALSIFKETFGLDLIRVNYTSEPNPYYVPFVGTYPDWDLYLDTLLSDLPDDGYWAALDRERLQSWEYLDQHALQTELLLLDSPTALDGLFKFDDTFESYVTDLVETTGLVTDALSDLADLGDPEQLLNDFLSTFGESFGINQTLLDALYNTTFSELFDVLDALSTMNLNLESFVPERMILFSLEYEGDEDGLTKVGDDQYSFDLWKAMNYDGEELLPSKKIYIALTGALFSGITVTVRSGEVVWNSPNFFELSQYLLDRIELLAFYSGEDVDLTPLYGYNFKGNWEAEGPVAEFYCNLHEKVVSDDEFDFADHLYTLGFQGLRGIPLGLLEGIDHFKFKYNVSDVEPLLEVTKTVDNATKLITDPVQWTVTVRNVGSVPAYGIVPDALPQEFQQELGQLVGVGVPSWQDALEAMPEDLVQTLLDQFAYDSVEELTGVADARFFMVDYNDDGVVDAYVPDATNPALDLPYNPLVADWLRSPEAAEVTGLDPLVLLFWAAMFDNPASLYNPDNYRLDPGDQFTFTGTTSLAVYDSYTPFYEANHTVGGMFPYLIRGQSANSTTPGMSLSWDNESWVIDSTQVGSQNLVKVLFQFQNATPLNPDKTLDRIIFSYKGHNNHSLAAGEITWEVYDWSTGQFTPLVWNTNSVEEANFTVGINDPDGVYYDEANNHTVYLQLTIDAADATQLAIDYVNMSFAQRDVNGVPLPPAKFIYSTGVGLNRHKIRSNGVLLGTNDLPSIVIRSALSSSVSEAGDELTYYLNLNNNGSSVAKNVSVKVAIPGVVSDPGNFKFEGNGMVLRLDDLAPGETVENLSFNFKVANGALLPGAFATWEHEHDVYPDRVDYNSTGNQLLLVSPLDYSSSGKTPYLHHVRVATSFNSTAPEVGDYLEVRIYVKNLGQDPLRGLELLWPAGVEGFEIYDQGPVLVDSIPGLGAFETTRLVRKASYRGYLFPELKISGGNESALVSQVHLDPVTLGVMSLSLEKEVSEVEPFRGGVVTVRVNLTNTGTIEMGSLLLDDSYSYDQRGYRLESGKLILEVETLRPGESVILEYQVRAVAQGDYELRAARVKYFFGGREVAYSNQVPTRVRDLPWILALWLVVPTSVALLVLAIFVRVKRRYKVEELEQLRREELLFGQALTEKMWEKQVVTQYLDAILKQESGRTAEEGVS